MSPERDLFANFERMRREMDELLGNVLQRARLPGRGGGFSPAVDVYYVDSPPRAIVEAELAGIDPDAVSLEIRGRELVLSGRRRVQESEGRLYQQIEVEHGPFRRVIPLGADVRADEARAVYEDGILRVELPLAKREATTRSVPIDVPREDGS
jgi:HSP20 family protein